LAATRVCASFHYDGQRSIVLSRYHGAKGGSLPPLNAMPGVFLGQKFERPCGVPQVVRAYPSSPLRSSATCVPGPTHHEDGGNDGLVADSRPRARCSRISSSSNSVVIREVAVTSSEGTDSPGAGSLLSGSSASRSAAQ